MWECPLNVFLRNYKHSFDILQTNSEAESDLDKICREGSILYGIDVVV